MTSFLKEALRALLDYGVEVESWSRGELVYTPSSGPLSLATIVVLLYADNMVMFSMDARKLVEMLKVVDLWASEMAMRINVAKTKIMSVGRGAPNYLLTPHPQWLYAASGIFQVFGRHCQLPGQLAGGGWCSPCALAGCFCVVLPCVGESPPLDADPGEDFWFFYHSTFHLHEWDVAFDASTRGHARNQVQQLLEADFGGQHR